MDPEPHDQLLFYELDHYLLIYMIKRDVPCPFDEIVGGGKNVLVHF
jgi:hypothetical protein